MLVIMDTLSHFVLVLYLYHNCIVILVTMLVAKKPYFCSSDIWGIPYLFFPYPNYYFSNSLHLYMYYNANKTSAIWM
jgi:hypothetical protein